MITTQAITDRRTSSKSQLTVPTRRPHRERDFGVGYGNSSGYAANKRYTSDWAQPLFRCL